MLLSQLLIDIYSLTVLHRITQTPLLIAYQNALRALDADKLSFSTQYSALVRQLLSKDAANAFTEAILTDENALTQHIADPSDALMQAASRDLQILQDLLSLHSTALIDEAATRFADPALCALPALSPQTSLPFADANVLLSYYRTHGYGNFSLHTAFCLDGQGNIKPVTTPDRTALSDLIGYERERHQIVQNTLAFLSDKPSNNALLYGDKGTGKSSSIKAIANEYAARGLKILSATPANCIKLPQLFETLAYAPFHFILFLDDLCFQPEDPNFTALKAFIEGGLHHAPDNVLIYATSNRRHLVAERFSDRTGDAVNVRDVLESSTSLSDRFGLQITFSVPDKESYFQIVEALCAANGIMLEQSQLRLLAERFALRRNGRSPRTAHQFVHHLLADSLPKL